MLALFAAAVVAAAPVPAPERAASVAEPAANASTIFVMRVLPSGRCKGAGRLQTSFGEPALLFRERDRDAARPRKLAELPPATLCLLAAR